ncbi:MAG TPA: DNA adenine methylase [Hanamia sp.]
MASSINYSPLRYPGGKSCLSNFVKEVAQLNRIIGGVYMELYAGGAGAALNLLFNGTFSRVHINDYDYNIYCMWYSILNHPQAFINRINKTSVTIEEWHRQKAVFFRGGRSSIVDLGFATFFLNRTNRSGIIFKAGPIGGLRQDGNYKIDVRFNKEKLIERIKMIASRRDDIVLTNLDALDILNNIHLTNYNIENLFIYMDPPYYKKGKQLYLNNYKHNNHLNLANTLRNIENIKWLISYDNVSEIKQMYGRYRMASFNLNYTLQTKKFGSELLVFCDDLELPTYIRIRNRTGALTLLNE